MRQPVPKISGLVVSAIRSLREARGSTSRDIMNYIIAEHRAGDAAIQRRLNAALKRGIEYGILKRVNGHYTLNGDPFTVSPYVMVPQDAVSKRKPRRKRTGRMRKGRRIGRRTRRTQRSRRGKGMRRRTTKMHEKIQRRGALSRNGEINPKRSRRKTNEPIEKPNSEIAPMERLRAKHQLSEHRPADVEVPRHSSSGKVRERSRSRSRRSQSQPRQQARPETPVPSPSRSSASSEHEEQDDNHQDD